VMSGTMDVVIAAGVESMSRVPMGLSVSLPAQNGFGLPKSPWQEERYPGIQFSQFMGAEMVAEKYNLTKDQLDEYSYRSHQRAIAATQAGAFKDEIIGVEIKDADGKILDFHYLPAKARIEVQDGQKIEAGQMLARQPRSAAGTQDIVGGLPRVTEIFEARKPKDPAVMAEISGRVELLSDKRKGKMTIRVISDTGIEKDHHVPQDRHLLVHTGDYVSAGDPLIEGPLVPHDILRIKGEEALWTYMLDEVQNVYRAQGVPINDKHIEVILAQMLRKVRVENPGDTELLPFDVVDKWEFKRKNAEVAEMVRITDSGGTELPVDALVHKDEVKEANARAEAAGREIAKTKRARPATGRTLLLGITKAALSSESFLSGASFQESTKVLTEASLKGATDDLFGLKENVLLGHLIPAGTGFKPYQNMKVQVIGAPAIDPDDDEELMLAEAADRAERLGAGRDEPLGMPQIQVPGGALGDSRPAQN